MVELSWRGYYTVSVFPCDPLTRYRITYQIFKNIQLFHRALGSYMNVIINE